MNLDEQLKKYKENKEVQPREEKIQETIETSKERFLLAEAEKTLSYYRKTIMTMLTAIDRPPQQIVTDDLRRYLTDYQNSLEL